MVVFKFPKEETRELLKRGILKVREVKSPTGIVGYLTILKFELYQGLHSYLKDYITRISEDFGGQYIESIKDRINLIGFDDNSRQEKRKEILEELSNKIPDYALKSIKGDFVKSIISNLKSESLIEYAENKKFDEFLILIDYLEFNDQELDSKGNCIKKPITYWIKVNIYLKVIEYLKNEMFSSNRKKEIKGFNSKLSDHQIESLYEKMQDSLIETSLENFKKIFEQNHTNFTPIKKTKKFSNALLIYFTSELFQKENPGDYVSITEYCFNAKNLSQAQNNYIQYNDNRKPRGYEEIYKIIQSLQCPLQ